MADGMIAPLTILVLVVVVALIVWRGATKSKRDEPKRESDPALVYRFDGRVYVSLEQAERSLGSGGIKTTILVRKEQPILRIAFKHGAAPLYFHDVDPRDLNDVSYSRSPWVLIIEHQSEAIPMRPLIVHPGDLALADHLTAARNATVVASSAADDDD